jgi:hypothetical protein|tara:strand:- start:4303 stop:4962 length:660 start_codon:yes stop_codon:yes gene_type:complete
MIAETLAGIALFKSAVDGIKSAIGTANDVSEIAGFIDNLFEGEQQIQKKRSAKSGVSVADQFGVKSVASEIIDAKLAKEQMYEVAQMVDLRFGSGTWKSIVEERARRIQAAKEAAAAERRRKIEEAREFEENLKQFFIIAGAVVAVILFFGLMIALAARADTVFVECRLAKYKKVNLEWYCYYEGANKTRTSMVISEFCPTSYMCEYDPNSDSKIVEWE